MRVGVVGFGNMGSAFAEGLSGKIGKEKVLVFDTDPAKRDLAVEMGFPVASDLMFLVRESDLILLAVKPKDVKGVLEAIREDLEGRILGSVAAGVDTGTLKELSGTDRLVRLMPNINVKVRKGAIAITFGQGLSEKERTEVLDLFSACGNLYILPENLFDAFTALAGSGPAFVMVFIDALAMAGVREGLSYDRSLSIVLDTVLGTADLLKSLGGNPSEWVTRVTSPGGTTVEGIKVLEERGFRGTVMECVARTSEKARRLKA
ncbi:MAG: pyrroline-5-carboxylate reductase [Aquificota bacterium]|nr:pyrroline-5-carboxylate reductase [Aquificota bacterium]